MGFVHSVAPPEERDTTAVTDSLAKPYALEKYPKVKNIPAVSPAHVLIDSATQLRAREKFAIKEIISVHASMTPLSLFRTDPTDEESAGFCGEFLIALALVHGAVTLELYRDEVLHDPQIRSLMTLVKNTKPSDMNGHTLVIKLKDGREVTSDVKPGGQDLSDLSQILEKFDYCAGKAVSSKAVGTIRDLVLDLENQTSIAPLMDAVAGRV